MAILYEDLWGFQLYREKITIVVEPTTDVYARYHAKAIDQPLDNTGHWNDTQPDTYLGIIAAKTTHEQTVDLPEGLHYVEYAVSGYVPSYAWRARIYVNDRLVADGLVGRDVHLKAEFAVGPYPVTWWTRTVVWFEELETWEKVAAVGAPLILAIAIGIAVASRKKEVK